MTHDDGDSERRTGQEDRRVSDAPRPGGLPDRRTGQGDRRIPDDPDDDRLPGDHRGLPRQPKRGVRVSDGLWNAALATARARGDSVSQVIRDCLRRYVTRHAADMRADAERRRRDEGR